MSETSNPEAHRPIRTFGRIGGRALSGRQQGLIDTLLPHLAVPIGEAASIDPLSLFENAKDVWLEIGFGGAEHFLEQARRNPETGFIGCEPFIEGMAKALTGIEDTGLTNTRLWMDDARDMMARLTPHSLNRVFILFPDPWPKKRQQKRRLIQDDFLDEIIRLVKPGGQVRFATDVMSYADEALARFSKKSSIEWLASSADNWRKPPNDHVTTRYETKQLGDCAPVWFDFQIK